MTTLALKIDVPEATEIRVTETTLTAKLADGRAISVPLAWHPRLVHARLKSAATAGCAMAATSSR